MILVTLAVLLVAGSCSAQVEHREVVTNPDGSKTYHSSSSWGSSSYQTSNTGPGGIITGRMGFADMSGKGRHVQYEMGKDGNFKVTKELPIASMPKDTDFINPGFNPGVPMDQEFAGFAFPRAGMEDNFGDADLEGLDPRNYAMPHLFNPYYFPQNPYGQGDKNRRTA